MQVLLKQAAESALLALARTCSGALSQAAAGQQGACHVLSRHLVTSSDSAPTAAAGDQALSHTGASAATPPSQPGNRAASPHSLRRPYRSDIRRFVDAGGAPPQSVLATGELPSRASAAASLPPPQLDLVKQYLSEDTASAAERRQAELRSVLRSFQRFDGDTGSSEVQVARLTTRISQLAEHMREHRKDYSSRRGLEACIAQRRSLLQYLRRTDFTAYALLISRLGLRDTYAKLDRVTLQIQQRRLRGPSKPRRAKKARR